MSTTYDKTKRSQTSAPFVQNRFRVPYIDLNAAFLSQRSELLEIFDDICTNGRFILRREVEELEDAIAQFLGVKHAIGVGNGTEAIFFALKALGIGKGDEVITVAHTFVATIAAIVHCSATPILVDICEDGYTIDPDTVAKAITPRTKAIIPVHLNGRSCNMEMLQSLAADKDIAIIEDAAQALGTKYRGRMAGSFGNVGCFSFHPMKALGCFGDGGLVATDDDVIADTIRLYRNHGQRTKSHIVMYGYNSRLDNLQAAILLARMKIFPRLLERRREIASLYRQGLSDMPDIKLPFPTAEELFWDTYSSYVIRSSKRDALQQHLLSAGIETFAHWYPPLHKQANLGLSGFSLPVTEKISSEVLSLPIYPEMSDDQIEFVIFNIRGFYEGR
jgi:dTDP-4-amino-4,6-dideoxygalactose transaminase